MPSDTFDAIVIGTGQAGPPLAERMAKEGLAVAVIERSRFGGTCVNTGCTPTKALIASARAAQVARRAAAMGVEIAGEVRVDLAKVQARVAAIAKASEVNIERWMRGLPKGEVVLGHGRLLPPRGGLHRVAVSGPQGERELAAPRVFLNTGARAALPTLEGLQRSPFVTNTELLQLKTLPDHLLILGGSYVGLEFGQAFRRFGSRITVVDAGERFLPREDADVAAALQRILEVEGMAFKLGTAPVAVEGGDGDLGVRFADGTELRGSHLLVATGRQPNTDDLGLDDAGVVRDSRGYIAVDDRLATNVPGIFALGDCNGRGAFTHTSWNDFEIAAADLFDRPPGQRRISDRVPCYAMFTDPPLARVGLNEAQVRERGRPALVGKLEMSHVGRARERSETDGFMKVLVDAGTQEILGAAFLGIEADEAIQILLPVMMSGLPYTRITSTVLIHPTVSELIPYLFETTLKPLV